MSIPGLRERTEERMSCGCSITVPSASTVGPNHVISYCSTHKAAPDLLAACEAALEYLTDKAADLDLYPEIIDADLALLLVRLETETAKAKGE